MSSSPPFLGHEGTSSQNIAYKIVIVCFGDERVVYFCMELPAFFLTIFLWCLLISATGYSLYVGFGPPSRDLRDPFEEHED
jgi:PsbN protein